MDYKITDKNMFEVFKCMLLLTMYDKDSTITRTEFVDSILSKQDSVNSVLRKCAEQLHDDVEIRKFVDANSSTLFHTRFDSVLNEGVAGYNIQPCERLDNTICVKAMLPDGDKFVFVQYGNVLFTTMNHMQNLSTFVVREKSYMWDIMANYCADAIWLHNKPDEFGMFADGWFHLYRDSLMLHLDGHAPISMVHRDSVNESYTETLTDMYNKSITEMEFTQLPRSFSDAELRDMKFEEFEAGVLYHYSDCIRLQLMDGNRHLHLIYLRGRYGRNDTLLTIKNQIPRSIIDTFLLMSQTAEKTVNERLLQAIKDSDRTAIYTAIKHHCPENERLLILKELEEYGDGH